jgi:Flp pilus assembly protein TadD
MSSTRLGALALIGLLAACGDTAGGPSLDGNPYAPGVARGEAVDGLIVGHRLMAAGQYELALEAYMRAAAEQGVNVDTLSAIGSANLHLGRLGQAERILRRAIERDGSFVPAWNNLGVVLMEQDKVGEAVETFKRAFALDSGASAQIRDNLKLAMDRLAEPDYVSPQDENFALVRRGQGEYLLLSTR